MVQELKAKGSFEMMDLKVDEEEHRSVLVLSANNVWVWKRKAVLATAAQRMLIRHCFCPSIQYRDAPSVSPNAVF